MFTLLVALKIASLGNFSMWWLPAAAVYDLVDYVLTAK